MNLYNQLLMEHYHNPKNYQRLEGPDFSSIAYNPLCGDKLYLEIKIQKGKVSAVGFEGEGCIISIGTASLVFDTLVDKPLNFLESLSEKSILELIKLELGLNRLKCALLSLEAIQGIINQVKLINLE